MTCFIFTRIRNPQLSWILLVRQTWKTGNRLIQNRGYSSDISQAIASSSNGRMRELMLKNRPQAESVKRSLRKLALNILILKSQRQTSNSIKVIRSGSPDSETQTSVTFKNKFNHNPDGHLNQDYQARKDPWNLEERAFPKYGHRKALEYANLHVWQVIKNLGILAAWDELQRSQKGDMPLIITLPSLWKPLLLLALDSPYLLKDFMRLAVAAHDKAKSNRISVGKFYCEVLEFAASKDLAFATELANTLSKELGTSFAGPSHISNFITKVLEIREIHQNDLIEVFRGILRLPRLYDVLIPQLCAHGQGEAALIWHYFLLGRKDSPSHLKYSRPLLRLLHRTDKKSELRKVERGLQRCGSHISKSLAGTYSSLEPVASITPSNKARTIPFLVLRGFTSQDEFCARLATTRFLNVRSIIQFFMFLQVKILQPVTFRELLLRTVTNGKCDLQVVTEYMRQIFSAGLMLDTSRFCFLAQKLAREGNSQLLHDIVTCDMHVESFEDLELQESLLAQYTMKQDDVRAQRTMAVLIAYCPTLEAVEVEQARLFFRAASRRGDFEAAIEILEDAIRRKLPIGKGLLYNMDGVFLHENQEATERDRCLASMERIACLLQALMSNGCDVDPREWKALLTYFVRELQFRQYERLAVWLWKYYSPRNVLPNFSIAGGRNQLRKASVRKDSNSYVAAALLPAEMPRLLLCLGYQESYRRSPSGRFSLAKLREGKYAPSRIQKTLEGLSVLTKLRHVGLLKNRQAVRVACKARLDEIFAKNDYENSYSQIVRQTQVAKERYAAMMENIWGSDLFSSQKKGT